MVKRNPAAILLFYLLSLAMLLAPRDVAAVPPQDILIVHSYHQGFPWTDNVMAGMLDVLQKEALDAQIHVEYLDAKRHPLETFGPILTETLIRKTSRLKPKVILVSDDAAFDLMLSLRNELFPGVPLVFCGVNNLKDERLTGQMEVTGVVEDFDIKSTIDVILTLHKQATHLAVISDSTETGSVNFERFRQVAPIFTDRLQFLELYDLSTEELFGKLEKLPPDTIILNLSFFRDRLGQSYSTQDGNKLIAAHAGRAMYSCWDYFLVGDVVGGYMTSGRQQGKEAATMVTAILKGIRANNIPIIRTSPNAYMFDYNVMERFGIKGSALPEGSVVINRQVSTMEEYLGWILGIALFFGLQTFLILALLTRGKRLRSANAALQESEEKFRASFDEDSIGRTLTGIDGRLLRVNQRFCAMLGYAPEEIATLRFGDITHPNDMASSQEVLRSLLGGEKNNYRLEKRYLHKDGTPIWAEMTTTLLRDEQGSPRYFITGILDISERRRASQALRENEANHKLVLGMMQESLSVIDSDGNFLLANTTAARNLIGGDAEELIGKNIRHLVPEEQGRKLLEVYRQALDSGSPVLQEVLVSLPKGDRWFYNTLRPLEYGERKIRALLSISLDITARKRAEEALRASEEMMRSSQSVAHICSYSTNLDVNEIEKSSWVCSPEFYNIFGIDQTYPHTIAGWANFIHPDYREEVFDYHESVVKEKKSFSHEYKIIRHNDGAERWIHGTGELEYDEKGSPVRMHGAIQDITERKRLEVEKEKLQSQLVQAQKMESIGHLAGGIAHDFNNMLGVILGHTEMALEESDPASPLYADLHSVHQAA
ncbi:MAG: PAS domain S-box protein, partial [Desulfopila sp.]